MYTQAEILVAFNEEMGDAATLFSTSEITRWFNDGQARLEQYKGKSTDLTWAAGDRTLALPADFALIDCLAYNDGVEEQAWEQHDKNLIIKDSAGATASGTARLYYWARYPDITGAVPSELARDADAACVYYALSRGFRKLSANRALYKRYSTLLGANAVTMEDLRRMCDELYEDYVEAKQNLVVFRG